MLLSSTLETDSSSSGYSDWDHESGTDVQPAYELPETLPVSTLNWARGAEERQRRLDLLRSLHLAECAEKRARISSANKYNGDAVINRRVYTRVPGHVAQRNEEAPGGGPTCSHGRGTRGHSQVPSALQEARATTTACCTPLGRRVYNDRRAAPGTGLHVIKASVPPLST